MTHSQSIELVTHAYDPPGMDLYALLIRLQFASLYRHPPTVPTVYAICYLPGNETVEKALKWIRETLTTCPSPTLTVEPLPLSQEKLFRRAIGRNIRALATEADAICFLDADVWFGKGAIQAICETASPDSEILYPREWMTHICPAIGDQEIEQSRHAVMPMIDYNQFKRQRNPLAIGAFQILGGNHSRKAGYLNRTIWVKPVTIAKGWRQTACDRALRHKSGLKSRPVLIPNLYHIRHSQEGRDRDAFGNVRGKRVW